jgi:hypothetical protein
MPKSEAKRATVQLIIEYPAGLLGRSLNKAFLQQAEELLQTAGGAEVACVSSSRVGTSVKHWQATFPSKGGAEHAALTVYRAFVRTLLKHSGADDTCNFILFKTQIEEDLINVADEWLVPALIDAHYRLYQESGGRATQLEFLGEFAETLERLYAEEGLTPAWSKGSTPKETC